MPEKLNNKIIVYGGTGHFGKKVVDSLTSKGVFVRVVSRNKEKAGKLFGEKTDIFQGDVTLRKTVTDSLDGIQSIVICLSALNRKQFNSMKQIERDSVLIIMEEAEKLNIQRLVYMSGYEIMEPLQLLRNLNALELGAIKLEIETKIKQSNFNWTILGDAPSYELFFSLLRNGKLTIPGGGLNAVPCISPQDVGEIAAQSAIRNDLGGLRFKMTGPKAYSFPQVAKLLTEITGKKIKLIKIPLSIINFVSIVIYPFNPFVRYIYKSLKVLNNFPKELAEQVPIEHTRLIETFDYKPVSLEMEIGQRIKENK